MRILMSLVLVICSLVIGYGFYHLNQNDTFNAVIFTVGLLGLIMSVLRNSKKAPDQQP